MVFNNLYSKNYRIVERCKGGTECPYTAGVLAYKIATQLKQDIILYDAKVTKYINGYWHLAIMPLIKTSKSYKKTMTSIITTNGIYSIPVIMNLKNKDRFRNLFLDEQNGMYIGKPDLKNLIPLYENKNNKHYVVFIDRLWDDSFFQIISELTKRKKTNFNLYLAPVFAGGKRERFQGKIFWSLVDNDFYTMNVALFLSSLPHEAKYTQSEFYTAVEKFVLEKNPQKLAAVKKELNFFNDDKLLDKNKKISIALKYDNPFINAFIVDNRVYFYPFFIKNKNYSSIEEYKKELINYFFKLLKEAEKIEKNKKVIFKNNIPFPKKVLEKVKGKKCGGKH